MSQERLRGPQNPPRFGADHYVPVVKTLRGEFTALGNARSSLLKSLTPFVEVANKQGDANEISSRSPLAHIAENVSEFLGGDTWFFLDFSDGLPSKTITRILSDVSALGLLFIPVIGPGRDVQTRAVRASLRFDNGVCLRVPVTGRVRR